jgi:4-hydroxy-tetrahydrodipicolinate synthase
MFSGAFTALVTPFRNGEVDVEALENLVEFQIGQGIHGLVPCGTTGETPYYNKPTQEGLYRHFAAIAESTSLPIVLYNIPGRTSVTVSAETTARLAEIPNIVGTKEATHSMDLASDIRRLCGEEFDILSGDDSLTLPLMSLGGRGVISVAANVAPAVVSDMVNALLEGDFERGRELHYDLLPLCRALFIETNPIPVKTAASILGLCSDEMRLPMIPLGGENLDTLRRVMEETNHLLPTPEEV